MSLANTRSETNGTANSSATNNLLSVITTSPTAAATSSYIFRGSTLLSSSGYKIAGS